MFVQREILLVKRGHYQDLQKLLVEWWEAVPEFPRAKALRHYFPFISHQIQTFCFEIEFESLNDLEKGWDEFQTNPKNAAYREKFYSFIEKQISTEIWRVNTYHNA